MIHILIISNFNFKLKLSLNCSTIAIIFTVYLLASLVQPYYAVSLARYSYFLKTVECLSFNKPCSPTPHNPLSSPFNVLGRAQVYRDKSFEEGQYMHVLCHNMI